MIQCIIFDLSEVLIAGLVGIEKPLSRELDLPEDEILPCFVGSLLEQLLIGSISEEAYLTHIVTRERWQIEVARLKAVIRHNFHHKVRGSVDLLMALASAYELALLSDHAVEWVSYITSIHPFLEVFSQTFYSCDLKRIKRDPQTFAHVLDALSISPTQCLFIDDNPENVQVAQSVGIPSVRFLNADQLATELHARQVLPNETMVHRTQPRRFDDASSSG
jgi:HAD superfamily hydrolase (TIGR01509 family)